MRRLVLAVVLALIAAPALADDRPMDALVAEYDAFSLAQDPITAGFEGDRGALARLPDVTPAADAVRRQAMLAFQARLARIDRSGLSDTARLNRDFLGWTLDRRLQSLAFDEARFAFN
ncbi:MAG: hypothetical protein JWQ46_948, partial [Phenylobacterium sp.]|nr:hypothetical protein [Phenylobacterium sp.]